MLAFIRERGPVHPREVEAAFAHGRKVNAWGGSSNATTHLLDGMHYRGLLRVVRRDAGIRVYEAVAHPEAEVGREARAARATALLTLVLNKYAPLPATSLRYLVYLLGYGAPHLTKESRQALAEAKERLAKVRIDGVDWFWPEAENPRSARWKTDDRVRLLAPFDPIVWDRKRFELLWGWTYRFEAYTPAPKRKLGYYALPLLRGDRMVGWGNASVRDGRLFLQTHLVDRAVRDEAFKEALAEEKTRLATFLGL